MSRRAAWAALAALCALPGTAAVELAPEAEVKVGFVANIARFTRWPLSGLEGREITFCVVGEDQLGVATEDLIGRQVHGRSFVVERIDDLADLPRCQIAFLSASLDQQLEQACAVAEEHSILTVADSPGFAQRCAMVNLVRSGTRITFEVNQRAANRARIRFSSELLRLGVLVEGQDD